ncbi:MAG TPA: potassium/proton antiporter [Candidatus Rifleibacterium sp.]|nr:potassium/proton antiporter [Candidatus Rifleibacterium sp.]
MLLLFSFLFIAAVFSSKLSSRFGVPVLIAFLGLGIIVGSDVLNLFYFSDAALTKEIADILLIFILFDGGFRTTRKQFQIVAGPALLLATVGVALTALVLGGVIYAVMDISFVQAMLIASIISSTDAAAVMMITRQTPIREKLAATLNVESAANDPMAILLTLSFLQFFSAKPVTIYNFVTSLVWQFAGGVLIGYLFYRVACILFDSLESENRGYYSVLTVGVILLTYSIAGICAANGIIAVFFMGYWLGNADFAGKRSVSNFLEGISTFGNVSLFLMLGLLVFPKSFVLVWKEGLLIAVAMILIARPVAVLLSTFPFEYSRRERLFLMWGGIKGAVPIVLATYPAAYNLDPNGVVFNIIFFAVLLSCLLQGTSLGMLADRWQLTVSRKPSSPYSVEIHTTRKSDVDMFELHIPAGASCINRQISELSLPGEILISSIVRGGNIILPKGKTELLADDIIFVLSPVKEIDRVADIFS